MGRGLLTSEHLRDHENHVTSAPPVSATSSESRGDEASLDRRPAPSPMRSGRIFRRRGAVPIAVHGLTADPELERQRRARLAGRGAPS